LAATVKKEKKAKVKKSSLVVTGQDESRTRSASKKRKSLSWEVDSNHLYELIDGYRQ
jgi:hypothetical protein